MSAQPLASTTTDSHKRWTDERGPVTWFRLPYTEQTAEFGASDRPPTLAMLPGETIWHYGDPTRADSLAALRAASDGAESPEPSLVALPIAKLLAIVAEKFGEGDPHDVEAHFDGLVLELGGRRTGQPPCFVLQLARLLGAR